MRVDILFLAFVIDCKAWLIDWLNLYEFEYWEIEEDDDMVALDDKHWRNAFWLFSSFASFGFTFSIF